MNRETLSKLLRLVHESVTSRPRNQLLTDQPTNQPTDGHMRSCRVTLLKNDFIIKTLEDQQCFQILCCRCDGTMKECGEGMWSV